MPRPNRRRRVSAAVCLSGLLASVIPAFTQAPSLDDVLQRARAAVTRYQEQAALLIADEQCDQKAFESTTERSNDQFAFRGNSLRVDPRGRRKWQAELAIVLTPALTAKGYPWTEFRDVISVDGRPLADRGDRLAHLFLEQSGWSLARAREIAEESARFNIGGVPRTINTPAVPLLVLHEVNAARFQFDKSGEEVIEKVRTWKIDYRERIAPTLISAGVDYCPASGTFWVDPATGEVLRAVLQCVPTKALDCINTITVTYRRDVRLGIRLPAEMLEHPESNSNKVSFGEPGRLWVEGKCTYSNFRRFETAGRMIAPK